jgi:hypothetical protein
MKSILLLIIILLPIGCGNRNLGVSLENKTNFNADKVSIKTDMGQWGFGILLAGRSMGGSGIGFDLNRSGSLIIEKGVEKVVVPFEIKDHLGGFDKGDINEITFILKDDRLETKYEYTDVIDRNAFVFLRHEIDTGFTLINADQRKILSK